MRLIQFTASQCWRGHEQKIIYLYEAFEALNYVNEQWIICPLNSEIYKIAIGKNMNVFAIDSDSEFSLKIAKELSNFASINKADIVFIHSSKAHTISVIASVFFGLKTPLVLCRTLIKRVDTNFFRKWKYNYKGIKKIICVSEPVLNELKYAVTDHSKLKIVGSLTDINKFYKKDKDYTIHNLYNIPHDYKIIGNIAEFTSFKDHKTWVNTVYELVNRNVKAKYVLVGKGDLENEIKFQIRDLKLQDHIIFMGFRNDIPEILPEFDLFLFTSNNEPTGGVILESYACNVPVVAANAGGIPEVLIHNKTGLLADVGNPVDFANKVEMLLNNENLRAELIKNARAFLLDNFTKDVIAKKMYAELVTSIKN